MLKRKVNTMIDKFNKNNHKAMLRGMFDFERESVGGGLHMRTLSYVENPDFTVFQTVIVSDDFGDHDASIGIKVVHVHPEWGSSTIWKDEGFADLENLDDVMCKMMMGAVGAIVTHCY